MTAHLLALTVGPVQDFIAAARRTRDLWFGSYLLSEISKAAAKAVGDCVGIDKLIFPAPGSYADLEPYSPLNVANVILAELGDADPAAVARETKEAAKRRWRDFANPVFERHQEVIQSDIWNDQVDDVIEFYAAWHPYSETTYKDDRAALMRLLAARKLCRDFAPAQGRAGVPKSSLDGLRESVLRPPREWPGHSRRRLRLQQGEQLDVVDLVKRSWRPDSGNPSYPSVARIAADPWIRLLQSNGIDLGPLTAACRALGGDVVHQFGTTGVHGYPQYAGFPFEGTVLFRSRHSDLRTEAKITEGDAGFVGLTNALDTITSTARKKVASEPSPYLAVLVADGDRMGAALSKLNSPDEHRQFSRVLAGFANKARQTVQDHHGVLVYAGGDDVLAFVPVDRCLDCARRLHDSFGTALKSWSEKTALKLTLSVGLAIAHFMEPLEDLLSYGRDAERHAKSAHLKDSEGGRNGLAIHVLKRGGGPLAVRANWSDGSKALDERLRQFAEQLDMRSIPTGLAYDLHKLANVYDAWTDARLKEAIQGDAISVLGGKQPGGASAIIAMKTLVREWVSDADSLRSFANELLVARAIGTPFGPRDGTGSA
jgi:CRISPR-associated protein Cmr2